MPAGGCERAAENRFSGEVNHCRAFAKCTVGQVDTIPLEPLDVRIGHLLPAGRAARQDPNGNARRTKRFDESACARGSMGLRRGCDLMPLAAARAGRLAKFGA